MPFSTNMLVCCFFFQLIKHWDTRLLVQIPSHPDRASRSPVLIKHSWRWTRLGFEKRPGHSKATRSRYWYLYSYFDIYFKKYIYIYLYVYTMWDINLRTKRDVYYIYFSHILNAFRFGNLIWQRPHQKIWLGRSHRPSMTSQQPMTPGELCCRARALGMKLVVQLRLPLFAPLVHSKDVVCPTFIF